MNKIKDELNRWLVPAFGDKLFIDFDYSNISELQEEMDSVVKQMSSAWWVTPNEKRQAMNYGVDEDSSEMNDYYVPVNLMPLKNDTIEDEVKSVDIDYNNIKTREYETDGYYEEDKDEIRRDVFTTAGEAQVRAEEIGCNGIHVHSEDGRVVYMPCASHDEYLDLTGQELKYETKPPSAIERGLKNKVKDHNEKHGDDPCKRTNYSTLQKVFNRGVGAFRTNPPNNRPNMNEDSWAYARVNSFLRVLRTGKYGGGKHDTDLLPKCHPMSSKSVKINKAFTDYPQGATNNAKRMLGWIEKYGRDVVRGGTEVGLARANQLAKRESISLSTVKRINSFLARHEDNAKISPEFRNEPWKDKGYVAYNMWGGKAMVSWAKRISERNEE